MFLSEGREMVMKEFFIPLADGKRVFARYYNEQKMPGPSYIFIEGRGKLRKFQLYCPPTCRKDQCFDFRPKGNSAFGRGWRR